MNTETTTTETTAAPNLEAVVNEIYLTTQAQTAIVAIERSMHRLLSDLDDHTLRTGGLTNDEIRAMKDSISQMRMRLYEAGNNAGAQGLAAYRRIVPIQNG